MASQTPHAILARLRTAIVRSELSPGSRMVERDVAANLSVSRTLVRQAFLQLHSDGLLRTVAGRQRNLLEVAPLTRRGLRQSCEATAHLEGIGATEAASQMRSRRVALADELTALLSATEKELRRPGDRFARALELDEQFHRVLVDVFLEPSVARALESARAHVYRYVWMFSPKTGVGPSRFRAEHSPIVTAVRNGNAKGVRAALEANWLGFASRITPFLGDE